MKANRTGNKKLGRPPGDKAILDEYKSRMLTSPKSRKVLDAILDAALDDDHKHQAVAWKIVSDRILPIAGFDPSANKGSGGISITISTATPSVEVEVSQAEDAEDADFVEIDDE